MVDPPLTMGDLPIWPLIFSLPKLARTVFCTNCYFDIFFSVDVPIYEIIANELDVITEGQVNEVTFNPRFEINGAGAGVSGQGLWKLGIWASSSSTGEGERVGFQEQVMELYL